MSNGEPHEFIGVHKQLPANEWTGDPDSLQFRRRPGEGPDVEDMVDMRYGAEPDKVLPITGRMYDDFVYGVRHGDFDATLT